ncbi:ATP-dependent DNA helicase [Variovorax sp. J22G73]|uniref:ATP-dependent DNA helicase n=1 Tax=unclassified Variovorax TaxID=663243 RepID=UPI000D5FD130|nr:MULTISPECIES: ATP-dependent DNA helicase [unclassified Variovorax]MDM0006108.1 ATP-dependent DNA helicase [Variovorax sp. J22R203]MDM0097869.1 ATP-dependent DNA helicase [Variovorax sp. J22G73]
MSGTLEDQVRDAFAQDGALSRAAEQFRERSGQTEMAMAVARTIDQGGVLVVEAGTGVGKTFSYLVPALLSGERVLLSTATKTLQDQLFGRDLPRLVEAFGLPVRTALLKGRGSYLCLHRLDMARHDASLPERGSLRTLAKIEQWSKATRTGDLAELPGLDERSPLIPLITSTRENCLGAQCPQFKPCHVNLARREALAADIVVINHHLFFADLAVRETGMAELLPTVSVVVFDEAHQLNETGVQFLGAQLGSGQALDFARDMLGAGLQHARGLVDWQQLVAGVERAARELRLVVGKQWPGAKLRWLGASPEGVDPEAWQRALDDLQHSFELAAEGLATVSEISPDFVRLHERARQIAKRTARFALPCAVDSVRWVDVGSQLRLVESPLDIADAMRKRVLKIVDEQSEDDDAEDGFEGRAGDLEDDGLDAYGERSAAERPTKEIRENGGRAWVFTSATLGDEPTLRWFTEPCGLHDAEVLRVKSPFDYASQAALYVPRAFPKPNDPSHSQRVAQLAARGATELGGRTLVLTTTLRALRTIGDTMKQQFELLDAALRPEVLVQGELPKRVLMERFREGASDGRTGCVLVASASFWEGFDAPGDVLQLVVIDKLPFPPPNDPLVEARSQRLEAQGRSSFADYSLPEAAVALKQGAGRLIRRETDSGVLAICDTRLVAMGYGRRLLAALPPMRRLESEADFDAAVDALKN